MKLQILPVNKCLEIYNDSDSNSESMLEAQAHLTLQQVVEWGEEPCQHGTEINPRFGKGILVRLKRECPECWAELKEMCDEF